MTRRSARADNPTGNASAYAQVPTSLDHIDQAATPPAKENAAAAALVDDDPVSQQHRLATISEATCSPSGSLTDRAATAAATSADAPGHASPLLFLQYPAAVYFILSNEFCERFSFYGMRAILTMYLVDEYAIDDAHAKTIYHVFVCIAFMSPLLGSVLADDHFGRFRVILVVSVAYVFGHLALTAAGVPSIHLVWRVVLDIVGLLVIALATGGIKPCVSAFAADQFKPEQNQQREQFFSFFYFAINAGALLSVLTTPVLRQMPCLGKHDCYPLAFGVPGALMVLALLLFIGGIPFYTRHPPNHSMLMWHSVCCVCSALRNKWFSSREKRLTPTVVDHWTDYASDKYDKKLRDGVRSLSNILLLFTPVIVFWALFDQQGSSWVLQARCMDNRVGDWHIAPDQMSAWNAVFILILVPVLEVAVYPLVSRCVRLTALRKMGFGCVVASASFCVAAFLQIRIDETMPTRVAAGAVHFDIYNAAHNRIYINGILIHDQMHLRNVPWKLNWATDPGHVTDKRTGLTAKTAVSYCAGVRGLSNLAVLTNPTPNHTDCLIVPHNNHKVVGGNFRVLSLQPVAYEGAVYEAVPCQLHAGSIGSWHCTEFNSQKSGISLRLASSPRNESVRLTNTAPGALYLLLHTNHDPAGVNSSLRLHTLIQPNHISILYQVPQSFLITVAEVLISITGLEFSYAQAAPHMKSVVQAVWLMTIACGNMLAGVVAAVALAQPVWELLLYAALMLVVTCLFLLLAHQYRPVDHSHDQAQLSSSSEAEQAGAEPIMALTKEDTGHTLTTEL